MANIDYQLVFYLFFWYLLNYYYNLQNKRASNAADGITYIMILSVIQLTVGVVYSSFLWLAPDARKPPNLTKADFVKMLPSGFLMAGAHAASVFSLAAGEVAFAQIVKAAEPAFTAVISCFIYGKSLSTARWLCLIPIIAGVALAALKVNPSGGVDLNFTTLSLVGAAVSNLFAAFKSNEIKRVMATPGIKDRLGSAGNQFAVQTFIATLMLVPLMVYKERHLIPEFTELFKSNSELSYNLILSGLTFYVYNELACYTLTKVSAITQSVANTAKRVVVIVGSAIVFQESISGLKAAGCAICIAGVFLDSVIDDLLKSNTDAAAKPKSVILPAEVKASAAAVARRTPDKSAARARSKSPAPKSAAKRSKSPAAAKASPAKNSPAKMTTRGKSPARKKSD